MTRPKPYTEDECRDQFLDTIWAMVDDWDRDNLPNRGLRRDRLSGLAFSILAMLDGSNAKLPAFIVAPLPHPDDYAYAESQGEKNYWPPSALDYGKDISGGLHEHFYSRKPKGETE